MSEQSATVRQRPFPRPVADGHPQGDDHLSSFVSLNEAATQLGISKRTVQRAIQRGELIAVKQGRAVLVSSTAIDDFRTRRQSDISPGPPLARPLLHLVDLPLDDLTDLVVGTTAAMPERRPDEALPPALAPVPASLTSFVGRAAEVDAVSALLVRSDVRLVTLTGIGGVGKTRLALRVAEVVRDRFPDGVVFVPLASVRDPDLVLPTIAQAVAPRDGSNLPPFDRLRSVLQTRRLLLILDNVEQVIEAAPGFVELLAACPELSMLVTSRTLLRVSGERPFAVHPMRLASSLPAAGGKAPLPELSEVEAVQLFVDRAQAARPTFVLTEELAPVVVAICSRLEGLPLAIELAAARCAVLAPATLLARLDQRLPLLAGGPRDQPDRLRTMRNAIAWSQDLLTLAERAYFRRLAVFTGGVSLEAAEAIAKLPEPAPASGQARTVVPFPSAQTQSLIFDLLASLVDGTLLQPLETATGDQRYAMLETVREYALEQLAQAGEEDLARSAHAAHFAHLADEARPELRGTGDEAIVARIGTEHDNFRSALTWSLANDPALALRLSGGIAPFSDRRGYWTEGRAWLDRALESSRDLPPTRERAVALAAAGMLASSQREFGTAKQLWRESRDLAGQLGELEVAAPALRGLGIIASNESDFEQATALFQEALARFQALGDRDYIGRCLSDLGLIASRQGDFSRAIDYNEDALVHARAAGNQWQVCVILGNLGGVYVETGEMARGEVMTAEALELSRQLDDTYGVAINLFNLGNILNERGDAAGAIAHYLEMLPIGCQLGEPQLLNRALEKLGLALHKLGANRPAARLFGAAAAAREAIGDTLFEQEVAAFGAAWQAVRDALGDTMYEAVWASGRSLPLEQAIAEATVFAQSATAAAAPPVGTRAISDSGLTKRELEVLRLVAAGRSDREVADTLFVARTTASKHVSAILDKLQAGSRTEAVAIALRDQML